MHGHRNIKLTLQCYTNNNLCRVTTPLSDEFSLNKCSKVLKTCPDYTLRDKNFHLTSNKQLLFVRLYVSYEMVVVVANF